MQVRFYGTRGSIAVSPTAQQMRGRIQELIATAIRHKVTVKELPEYLDKVAFPATRFYGGNTSCVGLFFDDEIVVLDAGSGLRPLGLDMMANKANISEKPLHLLLSHFHWDHICGFPFFVPAYIPGNKVVVCSGESGAKKAFKTQQSAPFFPVPFDALGADIKFKKLTIDRSYKLGRVKVKTTPMRHPNGCVGYRVEGPKASIGYLSDTEVLGLSQETLDQYRDFVQGLDVVIVDAQYTFLENIEKISWGHSSIFSFIDICKNADIGKLVMFHHDPTSSDEKIDEMLEAAQSYRTLNATNAKFEIIAAYDGLTLEL